MIYVIALLLLVLVLANGRARAILGVLLFSGGALVLIGVVLVVLLLVGLKAFDVLNTEHQPIGPPVPASSEGGWYILAVLAWVAAWAVYAMYKKG